jgi:hypothetical protein
MLQVIKDYQLFMVVGILLMIDVAIMTTWQVTDPFFRETKQMESYVGFKNKFPHPLFFTSRVRILFFPSSACDSRHKIVYFHCGLKADISSGFFFMPGIDIFTRMAPTPLY